VGRRIGLGLVVPVGLLVCWQIAAVGSPIVPSIPSVLDVLAHPFQSPPDLDTTSLAHGAAVSVLRVVLGFVLAAATGIGLGILVGLNRTMRDLFSPTLSVFMAISPIAWLPVAILIFGLASPASMLFGEQAWQHDTLEKLRFAVVGVIWYGAFFPIAVNTAAGVCGVRDAHVEAVRIFGASRRQVLFKAILPGAMPTIVTGLRVGGGVAWRVIIAAEIFPGTRTGLGYIISTAHEVGEYRYAFAAILVIAAIGLALDGTMLLVARRVGRWQPKER